MTDEESKLVELYKEFSIWVATNNPTREEMEQRVKEAVRG